MMERVVKSLHLQRRGTQPVTVANTIGIVAVAAFAASAAGPDSGLGAVGNTGGLLGVRV